MCHINKIFEADSHKIMQNIWPLLSKDFDIFLFLYEKDLSVLLYTIHLIDISSPLILELIIDFLFLVCHYPFD